MGKIKLTLLIIIIVVIALVVAALIINPGILGNKSLKNADIMKEIYGFSATIKKIDNNTLTLEASIPLADLTQVPTSTTLKITVDDQTQITKLKFPTEITDTTKPIYPKETQIQLSDLEPGDVISVSSAVNIYENLKNGTEFTITGIFITEN